MAKNFPAKSRRLLADLLILILHFLLIIYAGSLHGFKILIKSLENDQNYEIKTDFTGLIFK